MFTDNTSHDHAPRTRFCDSCGFEQSSKRASSCVVASTSVPERGPRSYRAREDLGNEPIMTRNSNSDRSPTCCSSGLKSISRKESEDALTLDGKTIKVATEQFTAITDPDHTQRAVSREEEPSMYKDYVQDRLPEISDRCGAAASCLYTVTPDSNFVIDVHPDNDRVIIASPCSGHGLKHSAAIGEALAEQVIDGKSKIR